MEACCGKKPLYSLILSPPVRSAVTCIIKVCVSSSMAFFMAFFDDKIPPRRRSRRVSSSNSSRTM